MRRGDTGDVCLAGFSRVRADRERSTEMIQEQARTPFGTMPDGRLVEQIFLEKGTMSCQILTYGGAVRALTVPDRDGKPVGFNILDNYGVSGIIKAQLIKVLRGQPCRFSPEQRGQLVRYGVPERMIDTLEAGI